METDEQEGCNSSKDEETEAASQTPDADQCERSKSDSLEHETSMVDPSGEDVENQVEITSASHCEDATTEKDCDEQSNEKSEETNAKKEGDIDLNIDEVKQEKESEDSSHDSTDKMTKVDTSPTRTRVSKNMPSQSVTAESASTDPDIMKVLMSVGPLVPDSETDSPLYPQLLKCPSCIKWFITMPTLHEHLIKEHTKVIEVEVDDDDEQETPATPSVVPGLNYTTSYGDCQVKNESGDVDKATAYLSSETGERKMYPCNECGKQFTRSTHLKMHLRIHTGEKPYPCPICNKYFRDPSNLAEHIRSHMGVKRYRCDICDKAFSRSSSLTIHMRIHTGERPFQCSLCGKGFMCAGDLGKHMKTHAGIKPYTCDICHHSFAQKAAMVAHRRTHTGEKPFKCEDCGEWFRTEHQRKLHSKMHEPLVCSVCDHECENTWDLKKHMKLHPQKAPLQCCVCRTFHTDLPRFMRKDNAEKLFMCIDCKQGLTAPITNSETFECVVCEAAFRHALDLSLHMSEHLVECPFQCFLCENNFTLTSQLSEHMREHNIKNANYLDK